MVRVAIIVTFIFVHAHRCQWMSEGNTRLPWCKQLCGHRGELLLQKWTRYEESRNHNNRRHLLRQCSNYNDESDWEGSHQSCSYQSWSYSHFCCAHNFIKHSLFSHYHTWVYYSVRNQRSELHVHNHNFNNHHLCNCYIFNHQLFQLRFQ